MLVHMATVGTTAILAPTQISTCAEQHMQTECALLRKVSSLQQHCPPGRPRVWIQVLIQGLLATFGAVELTYVLTLELKENHQSKRAKEQKSSPILVSARELGNSHPHPQAASPFCTKCALQRAHKVSSPKTLPIILSGANVPAIESRGTLPGSLSSPVQWE